LVLDRYFGAFSLHPDLSTEPIRESNPWLETAVFALDRWLRRRQGVYEYTSDPNCVFRIQRGEAEEHMSLSDGTHLVPGGAVLNLHFWNEHMPPIGRGGVTLAWARQVNYAVDVSLRELALYLERHSELDEVLAICGDARFGLSEQSEQLARISERYGFEVADSKTDASWAVHRIAENLLIWLLALATNPATAKKSVFRRNRSLVYLSRRTLEQRYARAHDVERSLAS
jgi:YkoP domain